MFFIKTAIFAKDVFVFYKIGGFWKRGDNMEKVKALLTNPAVTFALGFALGALHHYFGL